MNDRFKFRVYYKSNKKIYDVVSLNCFNQDTIVIKNKEESIVASWEECVLLQSTGLKDIDGTLIYEGDIVEIEAEEDIASIRWDKDTARFEMHLINENIIVDFDNYWNYQLEIVGNVFSYAEEQDWLEKEIESERY